ncbi:MAG: hypothetical protein WC729_26360 [Sphingomonas sp.]|jgi:hypothetical protein|uniref:hypothetical protein n=1 Tax=Sphingomonas sp. TaxID=28214 RepID=UPI003569B878
MKITTLLAAAGIAVASMGVSTSATAQSWGHDRDSYRDGDRDRDGYRNRDGYRDRDRYRDRGRHYGYDRRHYGWNRHRNHCRTIWRYGHRVRVCR